MPAPPSPVCKQTPSESEKGNFGVKFQDGNLGNQIEIWNISDRGIDVHARGMEITKSQTKKYFNKRILHFFKYLLAHPH